MIDQEEIILMTKLALHEKKYGKVDEIRNSYFKWDYIYINNWYTRFAVGIAIFVAIGWMIFKDIYLKEIIPIFDVSLGDYLKKYIGFFVVMILVYTGLSTLRFNKQYEETQKRLEEYEQMVRDLDAYQKAKQLQEEELDGTLRADIADPGSMY